ncbi:MAG: ferritin-like domain-containing protein [Myxococcales bacterium]|nr:ferritin-like domain-containing protein [Myxococcales bacterium]
MRRIETVIWGLLALAGPGCAGGYRMGSDPCRERGGNAPTEEQRLVPIQLSDCIATTSQPAAADAATPEDGGVAPQSEESMARAIALCEVDCEALCARGAYGSVRSCARSADRLTVSCTVMMPGRPCGRLFSGVDRGWNRPEELLVEIHALEAVSASAFEHLALELSTLGAPTTLVSRARDAAEDERRHATLAAELLHARGLIADQPPIAPVASRPLVELALENAVEGCVRETWGALFALWRRRIEPDIALRDFYAAIGEDELRHASWSWDLDAWLDARLTHDERERVREARAEAIDALLDALVQKRESTAVGLARALFDAATGANLRGDRGDEPRATQ